MDCPVRLVSPHRSFSQLPHASRPERYTVDGAENRGETPGHCIRRLKNARSKVSPVIIHIHIFLPSFSMKKLGLQLLAPSDTIFERFASHFQGPNMASVRPFTLIRVNPERGRLAASLASMLTAADTSVPTNR